MAHFTIDPAATRVRITVREPDYTNCQEAYVATGDLKEFAAMLDCIEAAFDEVTKRAWWKRLLGAFYYGLEVEGIAMYPGAFPPDFTYDTLLGIHRTDLDDQPTDGS